jgi:ParB family chromosome partitioning protein
MKSEFKEIEIYDIIPPSRELRETMSKEGLEELRDDIKLHGLINPITVRSIANGKYEIIAGMRRYTAVMQLAWKYIPCMIREDNDRESEFLKLSENFKREDINPVEEGMYYDKLCRELGLTVRDIADSTNRSVGYIQSRLAITIGDPSIMEAVRDGMIGIGIGLELNKVEDITRKNYYLRWAIETGATIRVVQQWVRDANSVAFSGIQRVGVDNPLSTVLPQVEYRMQCELCMELVKYNDIYPTQSCSRCKAALLRSIRDMER